VSRPRDPQVGTLGSRPLPPRLDPRAGRPPRQPRPASGRSGSSARADGAARRPAPRGATRSGARPVDRDEVFAETSAPGFGRALGMTVVGALLPGSGFVAAGYRRIGWTLLAGLVLLVAAGAWLATGGKHIAIRMAVSPTGLLLIIAAAIGLAVVWALVVIAQYRVLAPDGTSTGQHMVGSLLVILLALGVAAPAFEAAHLAAVQRNLITGLFGDDVQSATVPDSAKANPWGSKDRVNVLLLGGDGGSDREGVRTDTVIVASIDTHTGATTTFSLPRNLEELPFPEDSPLHDVYPDGFDAGAESESLLNAVYRNGPAAHPDILGPTDNPGADFLKLGVGEALGLTIDYFVLVNLDGFSQLIDALGGITVNVNYYVPVNGDTATGALPDAYIAPGPDQHMSGTRALDFARGRYGLSDYLRMDRQRCVLQAIVDAADPVTLLRQYQDLARTTQDIVSTDVPSAVLGDVVDLAFDVKSAGIRSVVFDDTVINPAYPDYPKIRALVQQALHPASAGTPTSAAPAPATPSAPLSAAPSPGGNGGSVTEVADACAYDPAQAQAALDAGQPPTRGG
jgi:polyisoprenyl-teichoic acid--peptidoglycan teichoic acid transferase